MARKSKSALTADNLEALGAEHLAKVLLDLADRNPVIKRRLRLELAGSLSVAKAAAEVRKRLSTIGRSESFVDWDRVRGLAADLDLQRKAIMSMILSNDGWAAYDLMWRLMGLADGLYERCDDSNGELGRVFGRACADLGEIAKQITPAPDVLAQQVLEALDDNHYGQFDDLISVMAPALGESGLNRLEKLLRALGEAPVEKPADSERRIIGMSSQGPIYQDDIDRSHRRSVVSIGLQDIADIRAMLQRAQGARSAP